MSNSINSIKQPENWEDVLAILAPNAYKFEKALEQSETVHTFV